jgi:hypothetical protein
VLLLANNSHAAPPSLFHSGLSLQGFTGILNTPSAHVTREGDFYALNTNQKESKWREKVPFQDNYFFNVGIFSFIELGGTLFEAPGVNRDLSANVKFTSEPLFRKYRYAPVFAVGIQDISGGASFLKTKYVVISEDFWRLRLSAGYGTGPDRMEGLFAGGELRVHDWLYLLADYDTKETNVGARAVLPHFWKIPISFTATAKTSLTHQPGNFDIAVGFSLPLDFKVRNECHKADCNDEKGDDTKEDIKDTDLPDAVLPDINSSLPIEKTKNQNTESLVNLHDRLIRAGFMNVRVGNQHNRIAVIEYENAIFNHNELDALGVVTGMAVEAFKETDFESLRIVIKKKDISMLQVSLPIGSAAVFLATGKNRDNLMSDITIRTSSLSNTDVDFISSDTNSSFLSTSFVLWPGLSTIVGVAENGGAPLEYRLSLKPDLYINLWKGAMLNARWDVPVSWTEKMDDGKMDTIMERLMLFQGIKLLPGVMANLGGGMLVHDLYGTMNEVVWQPGDGRHRLRLAQTWGNNDTTHKDIESFVGSYRYYFSPFDLSFEATAGKFWSQDRGFSMELKRFFGDSTFSVYYKNSTTNDRKHWQSGGIQFAFPLTPQKDMKHYYKMQLRGTEEWSYAQETTFKNRNGNDGRGELNYVPDVPLAVTPLFTGSLHNQYLNRDRLNGSYIKEHLERLREAWITYEKKL